MRVPMHPADQFEAFRTVIDSGAGIADVAARFGVTDSLVAKRLKLGRLSPVILDAYREDKIGLEEAQAFAISDDQEAQERVFTEMTAWNRQPHLIRRALTADEIPASDKRVKFVGLEAYEAAGGAIRRDLFGHDDDGYVQDASLLDSLVAEKLSAIAGEITGEGWRWVEVVPELDYEALSQFSRLYPERIALSDEDQAELDRLTAEYDELVDTDEDGEIERINAIDQRIDELSSEMERWTPDTLATAGAIVTLCHNGSVRIERGLVRPADIRKAKTGAGASGDETVPAVTLSAKLVEDLSAQKTAAIAAVLSDRPELALAAVVHALALNSFYPGYRSESCLDLHLTATPLRKSIAQPDEAKGLAALEQAAETWREVCPAIPPICGHGALSSRVTNFSGCWPILPPARSMPFTARLIVLIAGDWCMPARWRSPSSST
jgi:ParB family transcriptional regulator, chromosome partitioning protein